MKIETAVRELLIYPKNKENQMKDNKTAPRALALSEDEEIKDSIELQFVVSKMKTGEMGVEWPEGIPLSEVYRCICDLKLQIEVQRNVAAMSHIVGGK